MKKTKEIIFFLQKFKTTILIWLSVYFLMFIQSMRDGFMFAMCTSLIAFTAMILLYVVNQRILIPYIQRSNRYPVLYLLTSILLISGLIYVCVQTEIFFFRAFDIILPYGIRIIFPVFRFFFLLMFTFTASNLTYSMRKSKEEQRQKENLIRENQEMELRLLKSQINPHFLFNALNNIYSMAYTNDEHVADSVMKLSQMMRYVVDDCLADCVPINKEINYIKNYIDFQNQRFEEDKNVTLKVENEFGSIKIPPMILQPFVENCFKHCDCLASDSYIKIELFVENNKLLFVTENNNSVLKQDQFLQKKISIGIANVRKRLDLIYKDGYKLEINDSKKIYRVELSIKLTNDECNKSV